MPLILENSIFHPDQLQCANRLVFMPINEVLRIYKLIANLDIKSYLKLKTEQGNDSLLNTLDASDFPVDLNMQQQLFLNKIGFLILNGNYSLVKYILKYESSCIDNEETIYCLKEENPNYKLNPINLLLQQMYGSLDDIQLPIDNPDLLTLDQSRRNGARKLFLNLILDPTFNFHIREYVLAEIFIKAFEQNDLQVCLAIIKTGFDKVINTPINPKIGTIQRYQASDNISAPGHFENALLNFDPHLHHQTKICLSSLKKRLKFCPYALNFVYLRSTRIRQIFRCWEFDDSIINLFPFSQKYHQKCMQIFEQINFKLPEIDYFIYQEQEQQKLLLCGPDYEKFEFDENESDQMIKRAKIDPNG